MKDTLQFHHDKDSGITYALDVYFSKEDLLEVVHNFDKPIKLMVGKSFVHPKDNYNHKVGRELSAERLMPELFVLHNLFYTKGLIHLTLCHSNNPLTRIYFKVNKHSEKPYFISYSNF